MQKINIYYSDFQYFPSLAHWLDSAIHECQVRVENFHQNFVTVEGTEEDLRWLYRTDPTDPDGKCPVA